MQACFLPADILLPDAAADFEKWAVVACDQFTSQPEYWRKAAEIVGDAPSTLNLVYPEAYLAEGDARIAAIRQAMEDYMRRGVLQTRVKDGFVLVRRVTESGERLGLVGRLDLEQYDFTPGTSAPVRATEGTILSRIPPRVRIRQGASIESPHAMMLIDDAAMRLIELLADRELPKLYDTELMLGGGHIAGVFGEGSGAMVVQKRALPGLQRGDHAVCPVIASAVTHGVEVGTGEHGGSAGRAFNPGVQVPHAVGPRFQPDSLQFALKHAAGTAVRLRP